MPWCKTLFKKLIVTQLVKKILLSLWNPKVHHRAHKTHHWTPSWASRIQFAPSIPISLRSSLMLSSHLRLGLSSGLLPSSHMPRPPQPPWFNHPNNIQWRVVIAQPVLLWATGWTIGVLGFDSRRGLGIFLPTTVSRTVLGPTQPPIQWIARAISLGVKWLGREADHSPPSSAEVKNAWSHTSTSRYVFMACCLVKHRDGVKNNAEDNIWISVRRCNKIGKNIMRGFEIVTRELMILLGLLNQEGRYGQGMSHVPRKLEMHVKY
jgi:hypothetical protein